MGLPREVPLLLCVLPFAPLAMAGKQAVLIGAAAGGLGAGFAVDWGSTRGGGFDAHAA